MRKIFGHRGLPQTYVENTITSLNKALEICDFIETDVRITRDEQLVLYHDSTIENKKIEELTLPEITMLLILKYLRCILFHEIKSREMPILN